LRTRLRNAVARGVIGLVVIMALASALMLTSREKSTRARYAASELGVKVQDNVLNLSVEKHGKLDVSFAFGIVYHLGAPDVFRFLGAIRSVCDHAISRDRSRGSLVRRKQRVRATSAPMIDSPRKLAVEVISERDRHHRRHADNDRVQRVLKRARPSEGQEAPFVIAASM
jgi:hypothetical protein